MRALIIFICVMMMIIPSFAQEGIVVIDSIGLILPILLEFRSDARKHEVFTADAILSRNLGGIFIVNKEQIQRLSNDTISPIGIVKKVNYRGLYDYTYTAPTIYLQNKVVQSPYDLRYVIYHEIGHILGLPHTDGIMSPVYTLGDTGADWNMLLIDYFNKIRGLTNDAYMKRTDNTHIPQ